MKETLWQWRPHSGSGNTSLAIVTLLLQYRVISGTQKLAQAEESTLWQLKAHPGSEEPALAVKRVFWQCKGCLRHNTIHMGADSSGAAAEIQFGCNHAAALFHQHPY